MDKKLKNKIKEINRVFHEVEAESYDQRHPEIFQERKHWREFCERFLAGLPRPLKALDVGTGTGFVPGVLAEYLEARDVLVCADISPEMLKTARGKLKNFSCHFEFAQSDGEKLDLFENASLDLITVNSVLHHLPGYKTFFREADRVLKPGGILAVMHEPNQRFVRNPFLVFISRGLNFLRNGLKSGKPNAKKDLTKETNRRLVEEGVLMPGQELAGREIQSLVDVWSPTAGGRINKEAGFDPSALKREYFSGYEILLFKTYNHLGKIDPRSNFVFFLLNFILAAIFRKSGGAFVLVLKKKQ